MISSMLELSLAQVDLDAPGSESLEPPLEVRDMRHATTTTEGTEGTVGQVEDQAFCTCEADQVDLSDYGVSSAEYPHGRADSIPQMHAFDRPERVQLTTSSSSTDSS